MTSSPLYIGLIFILFLGCMKKTSEENRVIPSWNPVSLQRVPNTWLALGDSYTIGHGVREQDRFPAQAIDLLSKKNIRVDSLQYIATTGWTTIDLQDAINQVKPLKHTVVSLLIGVNDQYRGWDTGGYRIRFKGLLEKAIVLAGGNNKHVFVLSIPDYGVTPFAKNMDTARIRKEIDGFNMINREITNALYCNYVDITPYTREAAANPLLIANDGLHPSAMDYKRWAERMIPELGQILK